MADHFQDIRHRHSRYDRPNEGWVCGGDCLGAPCYLGPDKRGKCRSGMNFEGRRSGECLPRRSGDRWLCTRADTHGGQPCEDGPLPDGSCCRQVPACQPKPTLRRLRGRMTLLVTVITVAVLCLLLGHRSSEGPHGAAALNPGPLSSAHSALETRCGQCHSDMSLGLDRVLEMHSSSFDHRAMADSRLCLDCHQDVGGPVSRYAFDAHTMDPKKLRAKALGASNPDPLLRLAAMVFKHKDSHPEHLACATCHQEHHGLAADLKTFTNRQCQICHEQQFQSFAHGHPEFEAVPYPSNRRTRLFFDHGAHYAKHFVEKSRESPDKVPEGFNPARPHGESVSCAACHAPVEANGRMNVVSYQQACADCHGNDTQSGNKLPVIGYPLLDMAALNEHLAREAQPRSLGTWPADAPNDFPWLLLYLLPEDARHAWWRLAEKKVFLRDLAEVPPELVRDVERVTWGIKELFRDLCASHPSESPSGLVGHAEILRRLRMAGCEDDANALINGLPPDAFDQLRQHLGPELCAQILMEVDDSRAGKLPPPVRPEMPVETPVPASASGGAESFGAPAGPAVAESFGAAPPMPATESFGAPSASESFGAPSVAPATKSFGAPAPAVEIEKETATPRIDPVDRMNWTSAGGWHQEYGVIYYQSTGHADPLLKAWLEHLLEDVRDPLRLATLREGFGFDQGMLSPATGHCLKCHTVDERRDAKGRLTGATINWLSYGKKNGPADDDRPLTHYNHKSHLLFADCRDCHATLTQTSSGQDYAAAFPGEGSWDVKLNWFSKAGVGDFHGNFEQISKATCAACHTATKSGDSCLQCHRYHHPAPDGPADMIQWLRFREANPSPVVPQNKKKGIHPTAGR